MIISIYYNLYFYKCINIYFPQIQVITIIITIIIIEVGIEKSKRSGYNLKISICKLLRTSVSLFRTFLHIAKPIPIYNKRTSNEQIINP